MPIAGVWIGEMLLPYGVWRTRVSRVFVIRVRENVDQVALLDAPAGCPSRDIASRKRFICPVLDLALTASADSTGSYDDVTCSFRR